MSSERTVQGLVASIGSECVLSTSSSDRLGHARDMWPLAGKWSERELEEHSPRAVARPRSEEEVSRLVKALHGKAAIVPFGAGSGVTGAAVPSSDAVVIDLRDINAVVDFDPVNFMVTAGAGMLAGDLEKFLSERGFTLGHYPQSLHLATIGGLVSTRSSGTFSSKYGSIEALVLGLRVVLPSGEVMGFRPAVRSATGPELMQLFVGAEGTLGIITEATLRIFPKPDVRWFGGYALQDLVGGLEAVRMLFASHLRPAVLRLYDGTEAQGLYGRAGISDERPLLIIGHEGAEPIVAAEREVAARLIGRQGGEPLGTTIGDAWEAHRYDASWLDVGNAGPRRMADAIEVAAPWTQLAPLYQSVMAAIEPLCSKAMAHYSHFYSTGGCIYFIFFVEGDDPVPAYREVWTRVIDKTLEHGGTISHHHGVGLARADSMRREWGPAHGLLQTIKRAIDPDNRMNPGKLGLTSG